MTISSETERQRNIRAITAWENEGGAPRRGSPGGRYGRRLETGRAGATEGVDGMVFLNPRNAPRQGQRIRLAAAAAPRNL